MVTIIIIVVVIAIILLLYNIFHDQLKFILIKLSTIEEKINSTLLKRKELIKDAEDLIKEKLDTNKDIFEGLDSLNTTDMMELDRRLLIYISEFHLIKNKYEKLNNEEEFQKISFAINETEDLLNAYKDYYNDNASKYNKVIKKFPIIFTTIIKRRKEKLFFDTKGINDSDYSEFKY